MLLIVAVADEVVPVMAIVPRCKAERTPETNSTTAKLNVLETAAFWPLAAVTVVLFVKT